jgi:hypothetical protein
MLDTKMLKNLHKDDLLALIGLETRRTTTDWLVPTATAFTVGLAVGVGIGLLLAPKSGADLRSDVRNRMQGQNRDESAGGVAVAPGALERPTGTR